MSLVKKAQIGRAANQNDQLSPADIVTTAQVGGTAVTDEDFQTAVISQIKRIIFGTDSGSFYDNFSTLGIKDLAQLSVNSSTFTATSVVPMTYGQFVYKNTDGTVDLADITSALKMPSVGVVVGVSGLTVTVQFAGVVSGLSGLTTGKQHFVGLTGLAEYPPPLPAYLSGNYYFHQLLGVALSPSLLMLQPTQVITRVRVDVI